MQFIQTILALAVTLGILVTVHEYGHFLVARLCGVRVLRFSVGFGKPFYSWYDRHGTEFALAAIPLGGYVKMLDEREGEVKAEQLEQAFNRKSPGKRIAIASAGPLANFLFAIVAYWVLGMVGFVSVAPIVGQVEPGSPADRMALEQGMEIQAIDGEPVSSWRQVGMSLIQRAGEHDTVQFTLFRNGQTEQREAELDGWLADERDPDPIRQFGIRPWQPPVPAVISETVPGEPAAEAGLEPGDEIIAIGGSDVPQWRDVVDRLQASANEPLTLTIRRDGALIDLTVVPRSRKNAEGESVGFIGAGVKPVEWPEEYLRTTRFGPIAAVPAALDLFWRDTRMTVIAVKKMVTGLLSVQNLSGPITIARVAEATASSGFEDFIRFLAYLSITLGILNLLPVPVLDGGHILFYGIEAVRGKPLSERVQGFGMRVGIALILALMFVALYNDLMRL